MKSPTYTYLGNEAQKLPDRITKVWFSSVFWGLACTWQLVCSDRLNARHERNTKDTKTAGLEKQTFQLRCIFLSETIFPLQDDGFRFFYWCCLPQRGEISFRKGDIVCFPKENTLVRMCTVIHAVGILSHVPRKLYLWDSKVERRKPDTLWWTPLSWQSFYFFLTFFLFLLDFLSFSLGLIFSLNSLPH